MPFPSDTFESRLRQQRIEDDRQDAYYAAKYPAPVEEKRVEHPADLRPAKSISARQRYAKWRR